MHIRIYLSTKKLSAKKFTEWQVKAHSLFVRLLIYLFVLIYLFTQRSYLLHFRDLTDKNKIIVIVIQF